MELLNLLKNSKEDAFNEIYNRWQGILYVYACRIVREEQEAADIVQEVFISLWDKRETLLVRSSLSAYLCSAVRYKFFDRLDHGKIRANYRQSFRQFLDQGEYLTDHYIRERELNRLIEQGISALPDKMQEIFRLSRKEHLSHREIATRLGLSEKTVKNQVNNALKILRGKLEFISWIFFC